MPIDSQNARRPAHGATEHAAIATFTLPRSADQGRAERAPEIAQLASHSLRQIGTSVPTACPILPPRPRSGLDTCALSVADPLVQCQGLGVQCVVRFERFDDSAEFIHDTFDASQGLPATS